MRANVSPPRRAHDQTLLKPRLPATAWGQAPSFEISQNNHIKPSQSHLVDKAARCMPSAYWGPEIPPTPDPPAKETYRWFLPPTFGWVHSTLH